MQTLVDSRIRSGANTPRSVCPEILDGLPFDSPAALASRRDLRIINALLGSRSWFRANVARRCRAGERLLELGAGTGELARSLHPLQPGLSGLDLAPQPKEWPRSAQWHQVNVLEFSDWVRYPVVLGNLFFHHFEGAQLAAIGALLGRHVRLILANEPLRSRRTTTLFAAMCPLVGAHPVTRHDGRMSVAAGFRGDELPRLLGLDPTLWHWRTQETWRGASRLVAERR